MGPIQSSLNQLTLSLIGAVAGIGKGFKGGFNKPEAPEEKKTVVQGPKSETAKATKKQEAVAPHIGKRSYNKYASGIAANVAAFSGMDMIQQKARARFRSAEERKGGKK